MRQNLKLPLVLVALIIAAAGIALCYPQRINQALPPTLNKLSEVKRVEVRDEAGKAIASGDFTTTSDTKTEIERTAALTDAGATKGKAEIELVKAGDSFSKQEVEVALEGLAVGASFKLFVDDAEVITFKTNKSGKAALKFSSKNK